MNKILLIVERPDDQSDTSKTIWREFLRSTEAIEKQSTDIRVLSSNMWLLPTQPNLSFAQALCSEARNRNLRYELLACGVMQKDIYQAIDPLA